MQSVSRSWLWGLGCCLGIAVIAAFFVLLPGTNNRTSIESEPLTGELDVIPTSLPTIASAVNEDETLPKLPHLDFLPGSVEEACGLNELPPFWHEIENPRGSKLSSKIKEKWTVLESNECRTALETYLGSVNPYLWGTNVNIIKPFAFVILENPLTFERIFADPTGDLIRVQDALSRPECLLQKDETNWELTEVCNADAFLNYALINRFCFDEGVDKRERTYYWDRGDHNNLTPEQDRLMWKQSLEDDWIRMKCEELDTTLELTKYQPQLYELVMSFREEDSRKDSHELLIELAARFGDDAAGLTERTGGFYWHSYSENGIKYGRYSWLVTRDEWGEFSYKQPPSTDRFLQTFNMLAMVSARRPDPRDEIEFDWEFVAQHLCTPPYYISKSWYDAHIEELQSDEDRAEDLLAFREQYENSKSCKEIIHELRQRDIRFRPLLDVLDKFEQVALELEVYD